MKLLSQIGETSDHHPIFFFRVFSVFLGLNARFQVKVRWKTFGWPYGGHLLTLPHGSSARKTSQALDLRGVFN